MATTITQKEIAQELGVSRTLVTMALQGNPRISEETRLRVKQAADRLGYNEHTNREARALINKRYGKRPRTGIIAVFSPQTTFEGMSIPSLPYFEDFIRGVESTALQSDTDVFLCTLHQQRLPRLVSEGNVDGVITIGRTPKETMELRVPVVSFGSTTPWGFGLMLDNSTGVEQAVAHLVELGHRRIAYLGCASPWEKWPNEFAVERRTAFEAALRRWNLPVDPDLFDEDSQRPVADSGFSGMDRILARSRDFTALLAFNDLMAMGAVRRLREAGMETPRDISILGFDAVSERHNFTPRLSSVAFDREAMGRRAAEVIIRAALDLEAGRPATLAGQSEKFDTWFQPGDSCAPNTDRA